jgi:hypothetical protein
MDQLRASSACAAPDSCIHLFDGVCSCAALLLKDARRVSVDHLALGQVSGCRLPACLKPLLQDLLGGRLVVPDRDRTKRSESGRAVDEPSAARQGYEDIMRELVLLDYVCWMDGRGLLASPCEDVVETPLPRECSAQGACFLGRQPRKISEWKSHLLETILRLPGHVRASHSP